MFRRMFIEHPQSVGESYAEHFAVASGFGLRMLGGGLACLVHGVLPFLFTSTGSRTVQALHDRMVANRRRTPPGSASGPRSPGSASRSGSPRWPRS